MVKSEELLQWIENNQQMLIDLSDKIWEFAEIRFEEVESAKLQMEILEKEGFEISKNLADMPTAFIGSYGKEGPVIAILGEYDALSGLSQEANKLEKSPIEVDGHGHGCGHNLLGIGSLAAVIAVKKYLEANNILGVIRYYGCPGEEGGSGKTYMVRAGLFDDVDCNYADDWEMWLRMVSRGHKFKKLNEKIGLYLVGGRSQQNDLEQRKEEAKIFFKYAKLFGSNFQKFAPYFKQFLG